MAINQPQRQSQQQPSLRVVSLIPSATEIVASLGLGDCLVGRSHECDYPTAVQALPICTAPKFNPEGTSSEIHERVTDLLQSALSVYQVNTELLEALQPTHILTQAQCEVCAVSLSEVEAAARQGVSSQPQIISLQPNTLTDVWADIERVAIALGVEQAGTEVLNELRSRLQACHQRAQTIPQSEWPRVACIEWIDPLMAAGNWVPELVTLAGGINCFGEVGKHSPWMEWEELVATNPDVIVTLPCGFDVKKTAAEMGALTQRGEWRALQAVQAGRVFLTDGNQYFNRPGPRLVESLEILQEIFWGSRGDEYHQAPAHSFVPWGLHTALDSISK